MNLTVMISGSCDYLSLNVVHFAFESQITPPYELLEYHLNKHLLLNCKSSTNKQIHQ